MPPEEPSSPDRSRVTVLFLAGDVMTGRGIDQVLPRPSQPILYEEYVKDATGYVELAEKANGPIRKPVDFAYVWGDALVELATRLPDAAIVNLETSVTTSDDHWPDKGINYRMHPGNVGCLSAAGIDICSLANNHVLDWGYRGLAETISTLRSAGIGTAGAGRGLEEAWTPAMKETDGSGRVVVFAFAHSSSGVTADWAATKDAPGVARLPDLSRRTAEAIGQRVRRFKRRGDTVVVSIHWGPNWGYEIAGGHSRFAHDLIDRAGVDVVHGHSLHHPTAIEVYRGRLILYGCGDLINDYEGIGGHERFRNDVGIMYFPYLDPGTGQLLGLHLVVMVRRRFRLARGSGEDVRWAAEVLTREGKGLGTSARVEGDGTLTLAWR